MPARSSPSRIKAPEVDVYEFHDYRAYLRAAYEAEKARRPAFSYRLFARLAGLRSPSSLKRVIDGERNLSPRSIPKFARALGLDNEAAAFFADLVEYNQAESAAEKSRALSRVDTARHWRGARNAVGDDLAPYFLHWTHPAIHALALSAEFREDPAWIAARLRPRITEAEAASAVRLLFELGLFSRDERTGKLVVRSPQIAVRNEASRGALDSYHRQMFELAAKAPKDVPPDRRTLQMTTVCMPPELAVQFKERLVQVLGELAVDLSRTEREGSVVYQLAIAWFPLSEWPELPAKKKK